ncbi:hypothetical protein [Arcticibacter eurypsychrophilus]|uniref:hypothetical protein n=1 Tax=Arcticibacter eurypsychrophilus TaxID=1434752 RepID=UPI00084D98F5|nr:hypothetical protein [Arcticibacter eurypsychrophilus]
MNIQVLNMACTELLKKPVRLEDNSIQFRYRKSWWRMPYDVHVFAERNLIVINVEAVDTVDGGIIDFGASKRAQNKILNLIKSQTLIVFKQLKGE